MISYDTACVVVRTEAGARQFERAFRMATASVEEWANAMPYRTSLRRVPGRRWQAVAHYADGGAVEVGRPVCRRGIRAARERARFAWRAVQR